jgi:hypothetical protein
MKIAVLLACAMIAGCTTASQEPSPAPMANTKRSLTAEEVATVQDGVRKSLKDPNSAMFGPMTGAQEGNDHTWVCGVVNAKNSFGGYTGDKPFMGMLVHMPAGGKTLKMFQVTSMGGTDSATYATMEMCRRYGVVL